MREGKGSCTPIEVFKIGATCVRDTVKVRARARVAVMVRFPLRLTAGDC